jgi:hypothetical protein
MLVVVQLKNNHLNNMNMKKTIVILGITLVTLTATLAFRTKSEITPGTVKEEKVASNNGGGFALQDQDQWK